MTRFPAAPLSRSEAELSTYLEFTRTNRKPPWLAKPIVEGLDGIRRILIGIEGHKGPGERVKEGDNDD
jgi:hypothetical protein